MFVVALVMMMYINRAVGFARLPGFTVRKGALSVLRAAEEQEQEKETGHQTGGMSTMPELSDEDKEFVTRFQTHQQGAARLTNAEEVRTLVENSNGYGVLSTNSKQYDGYPTGSVVGFALDDVGSPFFVFSSMSAHTADVAKDGRVSLTVTANDFKGAAEGRVVMVGDVSKLGFELKAAYRDMYFKRHPDAFWIDFGDFSYWKMDSLTCLRYIGGFARAGSLTPVEYSTAEADPIAAFSAPVMKHMNDDHASSTAAIVAHEVGVPVEDALIVGLDALGMTVKATMKFASGGVTKIRVPFPQRVTDRKGIKTALVAMTQAANSD